MQPPAPSQPATAALLAASARPPLPPGPYVVAGLGRAGNAAARALARIVGPEQIAGWDSARSQAVLNVRGSLGQRGIRTAGGDGLALLDADPPPRCIVKSPGIPPWLPLLAAAAERGLAVIDELELGWRTGHAPLVAITGTNGKSTTAALAQAVLGAAGIHAPLAGNTRFGRPLSRPKEAPAVVCEVSSFQLEACPAFLPEVAVFTNLTEDHLSRHGTMERYGACKRKMFVRDERCAPVAVVNADDALGCKLATDVAARGGQVLTFGAGPGADYRLAGCSWTLDSGSVAIETPEGRLELETRFPGPHNARNATAALALAAALGIAQDSAAGAIAATPLVPGRFELVEEGQPFGVVVDFSHNADGVAQALLTARGAATAGRILGVLSSPDLVTGGQRFGMSRTARRLADHLILTTERKHAGEPLLSEGLLAGARSTAGGELDVVLDRRAAIAAAVTAARPGDVLVIMSRGPAQTRLVDSGGRRERFDDREVAREALHAAGLAR